MKPNTILLVDSRNGQYIPQIFAKMILNGEIRIPENCWKDNVLSLCEEIDIDNEFYWDCMNDLMGILTILDSDGEEYYITYEMGDLWAIRKNCELTYDELFNF
jgi:hypothetical protein